MVYIEDYQRLPRHYDTHASRGGSSNEWVTDKSSLSAIHPQPFNDTTSSHHKGMKLCSERPIRPNSVRPGNRSIYESGIEQASQADIIENYSTTTVCCFRSQAFVWGRPLTCRSFRNWYNRSTFSGTWNPCKRISTVYDWQGEYNNRYYGESRILRTTDLNPTSQIYWSQLHLIKEGTIVCTMESLEFCVLRISIQSPTSICLNSILDRWANPTRAHIKWHSIDIT
jgi:hypothetical protein